MIKIDILIEYILLNNKKGCSLSKIHNLLFIIYAFFLTTYNKDIIKNKFEIYQSYQIIYKDIFIKKNLYNEISFTGNSKITRTKIKKSLSSDDFIFLNEILEKYNHFTAIELSVIIRDIGCLTLDKDCIISVFSKKIIE